MTNKDFIKILSYYGEQETPSKSVPFIVEEFFSPSELLELKRNLDSVIDKKFSQSLLANHIALERATYLRNYLNGDMFTADGDLEKNKPCQILNSQHIIDNASRALGIKETNRTEER